MARFIGTGVNGSGIDICERIAVNAAKIAHNIMFLVVIFNVVPPILILIIFISKYLFQIFILSYINICVHPFL